MTDYYQHIIGELEKVGFVGGKTIFGAPYDWRLPVDYLMKTDVNMDGNTYETDLVNLVETAYITSGNKKVNFVTHSMGGPTALYFLNKQSTQWKNQYVGNFVAIAGPWFKQKKKFFIVL